MSGQGNVNFTKNILRCGHSAKIVYDHDWQEYRVTLDNKASSTYFTADKQDALDTAEAMINYAIDHPSKK